MQAAPDVAGMGIAGLFFVIWGFGILLTLASFILWIVALIDCAKREFPGESEKLIWILVIVLAHGVGALVYWFVGRPKGTLSP